MKSISWQCKFFSWTWTTFFFISIKKKFYFIYFIFSETKVKFSMSFFGRLCIYEKWWILLVLSLAVILWCPYMKFIYFFNTQFFLYFLNNSKIWAEYSRKKFCAVFQMNIFLVCCYTLLTQSGWIFHVCIFINSSKKKSINFCVLYNSTGDGVREWKHIYWECLHPAALMKFLYRRVACTFLQCFQKWFGF